MEHVCLPGRQGHVTIINSRNDAPDWCFYDKHDYTTSRPDTGKTRFHLCVCNVGDSLAYVYSNGQVGFTSLGETMSPLQVREATLGSHDITANRDMRDALGALGPVDGVNPELSNLTCR